MRIEPVFLFDLDGTLVDSVYQHVLAWKDALTPKDRALGLAHPSQDRHERRAFHQPAPARDRPRHRARRSTGCGGRMPRPTTASRRDPAVARRAGAPGWLTDARHSLGDRHQRAHGDGGGQPRGSRRRSGGDAGRDPRPGALRQARPRPLLAAAERLGAPIETRAGGRRRHLGHAGGGPLPARWASAC